MLACQYGNAPARDPLPSLSFEPVALKPGTQKSCAAVAQVLQPRWSAAGETADLVSQLSLGFLCTGTAEVKEPGFCTTSLQTALVFGQNVRACQRKPEAEHWQQQATSSNSSTSADNRDSRSRSGATSSTCSAVSRSSSTAARCSRRVLVLSAARAPLQSCHSGWQCQWGAKGHNAADCTASDAESEIEARVHHGQAAP